MKHITTLARRILPGIVLFLGIETASAQWSTETYELKGGWNAIYLNGDASYATPDVLFATGDGSNIEEIWRWNPNPTQTQFTSDPLIPNPGTPEWNTWYRNPGSGEVNSLSALVGQSAYLVKCSGDDTDSYTVALKQRVLPPGAVWVRAGANLLGFPTNGQGGSSFPNFGSYFATFPAAIAVDSKIYKYDGGDLSSNPVQVFSPNTEQLVRNQAYWFEAEVTGNFYAPVEITASSSNGLDFGRTQSRRVVRILNRTSATVTIDVETVESETAPTGEENVTGDVPLTRVTFNAGTGSEEEAALPSSFSVVVGPQSAIEIEIGVDRSAMSTNSADYYASSLRFTDSANLFDISLPATARVPSLAGLWIGDVLVDGVESTVAGSPGTTTSRPFPLRFLLHVDDAGSGRILSQAFVGILDATDAPGVATEEGALKAAELSSASRFVAAHMPLERVITGGGTVGLGGTLSADISLPHNDRVNPFVHQYHPDHDNKDARFTEDLPAGRESFTVQRNVEFDFAATPPAGSSSLGWGTTVLGGTYSETISGIHKQSLSVSGTFTFRRANEFGTLTTTP